MIEAVIWDFGGVLTTSPFEAFTRYETERGLPALRCSYPFPRMPSSAAARRRLKVWPARSLPSSARAVISAPAR